MSDRSAPGCNTLLGLATANQGIFVHGVAIESDKASQMEKSVTLVMGFYTNSIQIVPRFFATFQ